MESMNYTYERKKVSKTGEGSFVWGSITSQLDASTVKYQAWVILNPKGRKIAEATSEKQAELIVSALNGVAV